MKAEKFYFVVRCPPGPPSNPALPLAWPSL